jgi:chaperone modulatory protein CbpM
MNKTVTPTLSPRVVEEEIELSLAELCHACGIPEEQVVSWIFEGMLDAAGERPQEWKFTGSSLKRARVAWRLTRDLEINTAGVALALDLLDEIAALRARLMRSGLR